MSLPSRPKGVPKDYFIGDAYEKAAARGKKLAKPITPEQLKYLECLFLDRGFNTKQRGAWLESRTAGRTRFLDELFLAEASVFIDALKGQEETDHGMDWGITEQE